MYRSAILGDVDTGEATAKECQNIEDSNQIDILSDELLHECRT